MAVEFLPSAAPLLLPFYGVEPEFGAAPRFFGATSSVLGKVTIGAGALIAGGAVIRGDGHFVHIGDDVSIGEMATVHIAHDVYPAIIGNRVALGRNAVVHACTVGDDCVVEDNAVILDGSVLGNVVVIEANSTVFPRSVLAGGFVYAGSPAKQVRALTLAECAERARALREAAASSTISKPEETIGSATKVPDGVFVAKTACLSGRVALHHQASVFFGCHLHAGAGAIVVGENTNIQDNTQIRSAEGGVEIGRDTTIGHNVTMGDGRIGNRALIGIGCVLAEGAIVEDDVLLAAGAVTGARQTIGSGWLWGGRPARPLAPLDDAKRAMMRVIIEQYCDYARTYRSAQALSHG